MNIANEIIAKMITSQQYLRMNIWLFKASQFSLQCLQFFKCLSVQIVQFVSSNSTIFQY